MKNEEEAALKIDDAIALAYGDLNAPSFRFIDARKTKQLFSAIVNRLPRGVQFVDNTDLNYDVCITLSVKKNESTADVLLSLVGRYAAIVDTSSGADGVVKIIDANSSSWSDLSGALSELEFEILSACELRRSTNLKLALCGEQGCNIYNALFRDQHFNKIV